MKDLNQLYARVNYLLDVNGISTYELSKRSGIDQGSLGKMLKNHTNIGYNNLVKLADGFGMTISAFLDDTEWDYTITNEEKRLLQISKVLSREDYGHLIKIAELLYNQDKYNINNQSE